MNFMEVDGKANLNLRGYIVRGVLVAISFAINFFSSNRSIPIVLNLI